MQKVKKGIKLFGMALIMGIFLVTPKVNAQSPADDPGIGGPGSPGNGPSGDGGPIVPFDGGMSLMFTASGIAYVVRKMKNKGLTENHFM